MAKGIQVSAEDKEKIITKLEEFFRLDCTVEEACLHAGVKVPTLYTWIERDDEIKERLDKAKAFPFVVAKKSIVKAINEGNGELALKVLKSRQREIYYEKQKNETDVLSGGQPIQFVSPVMPLNASPTSLPAKAGTSLDQ